MQGTQVAGRLYQHFAARVDKKLSKQVERLLRTGNDEDLVDVHIVSPYAFQILCHPFTQWPVAFSGPVLQGGLAVVVQHFFISGVYGVDRKAFGGGQAAGKGNDFRTFRDFENFTNR